jgi:drug/metabolite transporter (DMT)-like permease
VLFALSFALVYSLAAKFLAMYDSVAFNLNLLTANVWGVLFGILFFDEAFELLTLLGFLCIVLGGAWGLRFGECDGRRG